MTEPAPPVEVGGYTLALLTNNVREFGDSLRDEFGDDPWSVLAELDAILARRPRP